LDHQIERAVENNGVVSMFLFDLTQKIRKELIQGQASDISETIYKIAKKNIRRPTDLVHKLKKEGGILIIAETDKAGVAVLINRVLKDIKAHKIKYKDGKQVFLDVKTFSLTFPEDGSTAGELFDKLNDLARIK
jgi:hypothetical protein